MGDAPHVSATRSGYDAIAEPYAAAFGDSLDDSPLDRGLLTGFAELVRRDHPGLPLLDAGSGPGAVAAHLHGLGLPVRGVDVSPAMVDLARRRHPGVRFDVGELGALDAADASLAGVVAWYSLVHVPEPHRPRVVREFARVLRPGGHLLLAFQVDDDTLHLDEAFGHAIALDFHRLQPDAVAALLTGAGFDVVARTVRAPDPSTAASPVPQAFLVARAPS